ncbi:MAG: hypothetical protein ACO323_03390 [Candidatus Kapaibacteriota bacterium]
MKQILILIFYVFFSLQIGNANDNVFREGKGNQLIPMQETSISLLKEVLSIKRKDRISGIRVNVYYKLYNPGKSKNVLIGFQAAGNMIDGSNVPTKYGNHPFIHNFTVNANNKKLKYRVSYLLEDYNFTHIKHSINLRDLEKYKEQGADQISYIYSFKMHIQKGLNILKHHYIFKNEGEIADFFYSLTPATKWANKEINDFSLILDLGNYESCDLSLLNDIDNPKISFSNDGYFINSPIDTIGYCNENIFIRKGKVKIQKKNFKPIHELYMRSCDVVHSSNKGFDVLPFSQSAINSSYSQDYGEYSEFDKRIMNNLQLAREGYIFPEKDLYEYFKKSTNWYLPNPNFKLDK